MPTAEMKLSATILGSGTCVPSLQRSACSVLVTIGARRLLFDSGPGTMRRLLEAGTSIHDVSHIFYSHFHPDHSAELVPFIFATKYPDETRRKIPLTVIGGRGLLNFYQGLKRVYGRWIELSPGRLQLLELDNTRRDKLRFEDFAVHSVPVVHNSESIAYRIMTSSGRSVVYSGDTDYSENLVELARDADLLICESALPDSLKVNGHLTPSLAGEIAERARVHQLVLTHFYPECDTEDIEIQCRRTYHGRLILAQDLMRIDLEDP
jgi:ribonuclease BN (tRNA processing enzyme)